MTGSFGGSCRRGIGRRPGALRRAPAPRASASDQRTAGRRCDPAGIERHRCSLGLRLGRARARARGSYRRQRRRAATAAAASRHVGLRALQTGIDAEVARAGRQSRANPTDRPHAPDPATTVGLDRSAFTAPQRRNVMRLAAQPAVLPAICPPARRLVLPGRRRPRLPRWIRRPARCSPKRGRWWRRCAPASAVPTRGCAGTARTAPSSADALRLRRARRRPPARRVQRRAPAPGRARLVGRHDRRGARLGRAVGRRRRQQRLRELPLERYLIEIDDGWVLHRARNYRGRVQIEDEEQAGRALLVRLLARPAWVREQLPAGARSGAHAAARRRHRPHAHRAPPGAGARRAGPELREAAGQDPHLAGARGPAGDPRLDRGGAWARSRRRPARRRRAPGRRARQALRRRRLARRGRQGARPAPGLDRARVAASPARSAPPPSDRLDRLAQAATRLRDIVVELHRRRRQSGAAGPVGRRRARRRRRGVRGPRRGRTEPSRPSAARPPSARPGLRRRALLRPASGTLWPPRWTPCWRRRAPPAAT